MNKIRAKCFHLIISLAVVGSQAHATSIDINASQSGEGVDGNRDGVFESISSGGAPQARLTASEEVRGTIEFPLTTIPHGATINSANLRLVDLFDSENDTVQLYGFVGDGLTSAGDMVASATLLANDISNGVVDTNVYDVRSFLASLLAGGDAFAGFRIQASAPGFFLYTPWGASGDPNNVARLSVDYTPVPEPSTLVLGALGLLGMLGVVNRAHNRRLRRRPVSESVITATAHQLRNPLAVSCGLAAFLAAAGVRADTIYVSSHSNAVEQFTTGGAGSLFANSGLNVPFGLAIDQAGNVYVANNSGNTIEKFTPGGVGSVFANTGLNGPFGLAIDSAGNVYASNFNNNTIEKFTPQGVGSVFANTNLSRPGGLAFDIAGILYVANQGTKTIEEFTPGGVGSLFANTDLLVNPRGLVIDSAGNVYAAGFGNNTIEKFTPGGVGSLFANTGLNAPQALSIDSAGNIYAANFGNNTVEKYTPGGVASLFATVTLPTGVAVAVPAPEPSTLVLAGFAIVGLLNYACRARRRESLAA